MSLHTNTYSGINLNCPGCGNSPGRCQCSYSSPTLGQIYTGTVGIGINNPTQKLNIYGTIKKAVSSFFNKKDFKQESAQRYPQDVSYVESDLSGNHYFNVNAYVQISNKETAMKIHEMLISEDETVQAMGIQMLLKETIL